MHGDVLAELDEYIEALVDEVHVFDMLDDEECGVEEVSTHGEVVEDFGGGMLLFGGVDCVNNPAES